jgi:hypothetical protein
MKSFVIGMVTAAALVAGASAQQTQTKPEAKPAAVKDVSGKWNMSVEMQDGSHTSTMDLQLEGKKVTGAVNSELGTAPLAGEFADGKLTFTLSLDGPNGTLQFAFSGTLKDDGTLAGSMAMGDMGDIPWTATRVKKK